MLDIVDCLRKLLSIPFIGTMIKVQRFQCVLFLCLDCIILVGRNTKDEQSPWYVSYYYNGVCRVFQCFPDETLKLGIFFKNLIMLETGYHSCNPKCSASLIGQCTVHRSLCRVQYIVHSASFMGKSTVYITHHSKHIMGGPH